MIYMGYYAKVPDIFGFHLSYRRLTKPAALAYQTLKKQGINRAVKARFALPVIL
jgi:hypothetical protein